jgi:hypothetical protein
MRYMIISGETEKGIQEKVDECLALGWTPQGGLSIVAHPTKTFYNGDLILTFYQAMIA